MKSQHPELNVIFGITFAIGLIQSYGSEQKKSFFGDTFKEEFAQGVTANASMQIMRNTGEIRFCIGGATLAVSSAIALAMMNRKYFD